MRKGEQARDEMVKDVNGQILRDSVEVRRRWAEYFEQVLNIACPNIPISHFSMAVPVQLPSRGVVAPTLVRLPSPRATRGGCCGLSCLCHNIHHSHKPARSPALTCR